MPEHEPGYSDQLSPEQQEFLGYLEYAKSVLTNFGINKLSTIEGVYLRKILEGLLPQYRKTQQEQGDLRKEMKAKKRAGEDVSELRNHLAHLQEINFDRPGAEAAMRWLFELYGILLQDVPNSKIITDKTTGKIFNFRLPADRRLHGRYDEEFRKKVAELQALRHDIDAQSWEIDPDFKEWLAREQDIAHNPGMDRYRPKSDSDK